MNYAERKLIIARKKSFNGSALRLTVLLDNRPVGMLASGETLELSMSSEAHTLQFKHNNPISKQPDTVRIAPGFSDCKAYIYIKMGMLSGNWQVDLEYPQRSRQDSMNLLCGFMLLLSSRNDGRSLTPKMEEFRRAGLDLHVSFTVRAADVLVRPKEHRENRFVGESFTLNYLELTSSSGDTPIHTLSPAEQMALAKDFERMLKVSNQHRHLAVSRFGLTVTVSMK